MTNLWPFVLNEKSSNGRLALELPGAIQGYTTDGSRPLSPSIAFLHFCSSFFHFFWFQNITSNWCFEYLPPEDTVGNALLTICFGKNLQTHYLWEKMFRSTLNYTHQHCNCKHNALYVKCPVKCAFYEKAELVS